MVFFPASYFVPLTLDTGYVSDYSDAPDRIYAQYRNKPKASAWYRIVKSLAEQLGNAAQAVRVVYDIDFATGTQLDTIGKIVVIPRNFIQQVELNPGLFADPDGSEFGDMNAMFSSLTLDQDQQMSDDIYRLVIKSKIIKNNSFATIEDILFGMNFLLPNAQTLRVIDNEDMSFNIEFYGNISNLERWALLNIALIPKPQGVKFNGFLEAYDYVQFGDTSEQFGDTTSQFVGFTEV